MINFSELLWKPRRVAGERASASANRAPEIFEEPLELGQVPVEQVQIRPESRIALFNDPRSPGADRFRFLRMRLREIKNAASLRSMVITSPLPQDGKSTIALNLATALAEQGKRSVLLIDADLYHPTLAPRLGLPFGPGFNAHRMVAETAQRQVAVSVPEQVPVTYTRCVSKVVARQVPVQTCTYVPVAVPQCLTCP